MVQERKCAEGHFFLFCLKIKPLIHNTFGIGKTDIKRNHQTQPSTVATGLYLLNCLNCANRYIPQKLVKKFKIYSDQISGIFV